MKRITSAAFLSVLLIGSAWAVTQIGVAIAAVVQMDGLILTPGSAPGSPTNGQMWMTSAGLYGQVNGVTVGPYGTGGGGSGLTINSTTITGGALGHVLYDDGTKLQEIAYGLTGNSTLVETTSGGLLTASLLPLATTGAFGAVKPDGTTITISAGVISAVGGGTGCTVPGTTSDVLYNNSGSCAANGGLTYDGTSVLSLGVAGTSVGGLKFNNATSGFVELIPVTGALGSAQITVPAATDTMALLAATQTLTNKTISTASNTITNATNAAKGIMEGDGQTITCTTGVCSGTAPNRSTGASFTIAATDMGGQVNFTGSTAAQTATIPAISSTVLAAGMSVMICNQASVSLAISSTPAINGFTPTSLPAVTSGTAACLSLTSNGTSLDAIPVQNTLAVAQITGLGSNVGTALGVALSGNGGVSSTIASGTSALGTGAISSGACAAAVTTTATNTATTDVIWWGFNGDPTAVTGYSPTTNGMLTIVAYPSANNVNFKVCNNTSASVTPGAITLNWRVIR